MGVDGGQGRRGRASRARARGAHPLPLFLAPQALHKATGGALFSRWAMEAVEADRLVAEPRPPPTPLSSFLPSPAQKAAASKAARRTVILAEIRAENDWKTELVLGRFVSAETRAAAPRVAGAPASAAA